jgi:hypothetical protein
MSGLAAPFCFAFGSPSGWESWIPGGGKEKQKTIRKTDAKY